MPRLRRIDSFLSAHRRTTALVGVILVLGVVALNAHAALPEHHHHDGETTVCVAGLSIAVLAALGWPVSRGTGLVIPIRCTAAPPAAGSVPAPLPWGNARAGPARSAVLRR